MKKSESCILADTVAYLQEYIALPDESHLVTAAWIVAAHLADAWDRFPHLAITSPEKRCGKTRFLQLIETLVPNPVTSANITPAAIYRMIAIKKPTLLLDEAQSLARRGSESSELTRELLNSSIDRNAKVYRCSGPNRDQLSEFSTYCPKVISLIGELDSILADRCLPIELKRKTSQDNVKPIRARVVEPLGHELRERIANWAEQNKELVTEAYDSHPPFALTNDRLAELLMPLQSILTVIDGSQVAGLDGFPAGNEQVLERYANSLIENETRRENATPGIKLLTALKAIFSSVIKQSRNEDKFISTEAILEFLLEREEEGWQTCNRGRPINAESLANLLRPYGIRSQRNKKQTARGYYESDFSDAFARYL